MGTTNMAENFRRYELTTRQAGRILHRDRHTVARYTYVPHLLPAHIWGTRELRIYLNDLLAMQNAIRANRGKWQTEIGLILAVHRFEYEPTDAQIEAALHLLEKPETASFPLTGENEPIVANEPIAIDKQEITRLKHRQILKEHQPEDRNV